jgi:ACS family glucarate transporter-like MFS transporter
MSSVFPRLRVRWIIFTFMFLFTFAAYVQRTAISVAAEPMMPQLGLTQAQIGWLETAFLISYTALQFPGGIVGQFLGARLSFATSGLISVAATLAIPILPSFARGTALFWWLAMAQFTLGVSQAPLFAMLSGTLERWFPPRQWALTQGLTSCGIGLGGAAAPAMIASLMVVAGWRSALVTVALPVLALVALWWWRARDTPLQDRSVTQAELAELPDGVAALTTGTQAAGGPSWRRVRALLTNRDLAGLTLSYFTMNLVFYLISFWSFLYLVQARHFTALQGGLAAALPLLAGAAGAGLGGIGASRLTARLGARAGLRMLPVLTLPLAGALLLLSVHVASAWVALAGLSLAFGLLETNEGPFWAASMEIGRQDAVAAGAILNTGGNLGGIVATPLIAAISGGGDWNTPFIAGAGCALLSALIWLCINPAAPATTPIALTPHAAPAGQA